MSEFNKQAQQEIAPNDAVVNKEQHAIDAPPAGKKNKAAFFKLSATKTLTYIAVLAALAVVTKIYSIDFGGNKFSLFYLPVYLAAALFGPIVGFAVGLFSELIGSIIVYGSPDILYVIGNSLMGLIMGAIFMLRRPPYWVKFIVGAILTMFICSFGFNTMAQSYWILEPIGKITFEKWWTMLVFPVNSLLPRIIFQPVMITVSVLLSIPIYKASVRLLRYHKR